MGPYLIKWETPCKCEKIDVSVKPRGVVVKYAKNLTTGKHTKATFYLDLTWAMTCSPGTSGCEGRIVVLPEKAGHIQLVKITENRQPVQYVTCIGPCNKRTTGKFKVEATSTKDVHGGTFPFSFNENCELSIPTFHEEHLRTEKIKLVFRADGDLDVSKSDLNGDGKPDGKK